MSEVNVCTGCLEDVTEMLLYPDNLSKILLIKSASHQLKGKKDLSVSANDWWLKPFAAKLMIFARSFCTVSA